MFWTSPVHHQERFVQAVFADLVCAVIQSRFVWVIGQVLWRRCIMKLWYRSAVCDCVLLLNCVSCWTAYILQDDTRSLQCQVFLRSCLLDWSQQWSVVPLLVSTHPCISLHRKYNSVRHSLPKIWSSWFVGHLSRTVAFFSNGFSYFPGKFFAAFLLAFVPAPSSVMLSQPTPILKLSDRPLSANEYLFLSYTTPFELCKHTKYLRWSRCFVQRHSDFHCMWLLIPECQRFSASGITCQRTLMTVHSIGPAPFSSFKLFLLSFVIFVIAVNCDEQSFTFILR